MNRIFELIENGKAMEKLMDIFISIFPALIVGIILLIVYFVLKSNFRKKSDTLKSEKLRSLSPYFYLLFTAVLWLTHNGVLEERIFETTFNTSVGAIFFFISDIFVFAILGFLFRRVTRKTGQSIVICVISIIALEVLQYAFKLGVVSVMDATAMLIGTGAGIVIASLTTSKENK